MIFLHLASDLDIAWISWVDHFPIPAEGRLSVMISSQLLAELSNLLLSSTSFSRTRSSETDCLGSFHPILQRNGGAKGKTAGKLKILAFHDVGTVTIENRNKNGPVWQLDGRTDRRE